VCIAGTDARSSCWNQWTSGLDGVTMCLAQNGAHIWEGFEYRLFFSRDETRYLLIRHSMAAASMFGNRTSVFLGVGVLVAADSQSTSSSGYRGLPLGPLIRFYLPLLSSSDNYFILLSKVPSLMRKRVCSLQCNHLLVPITILYRLI
jgi:hypothetical protein